MYVHVFIHLTWRTSACHQSDTNMEKKKKIISKTVTTQLHFPHRRQKILEEWINFVHFVDPQEHVHVVVYWTTGNPETLKIFAQSESKRPIIKSIRFHTTDPSVFNIFVSSSLRINWRKWWSEGLPITKRYYFRNWSWYFVKRWRYQICWRSFWCSKRTRTLLLFWDPQRDFWRKFHWW